MARLDQDRGSRSFVNLGAGSYEIVVKATGSVTGDFGIALLPLAAAKVITRDIAEQVQADFPSSTVLYAIEAQAGDIVQLDVLDRGTSNFWSLLDPRGRLVVNGSSFNTDTDLTFTEAGTYILAIEGRFFTDAADTPSFVIRDVSTTSPATLTGTAISIGDRVDGILTDANTADVYVFSLTERTRLAFDSLSDTRNIRFSIEGGFGRIVQQQALAGSGWLNTNVGFPGYRGAYDLAGLVSDSQIIDLLAGTYAVHIDSASANAGSYAFKLVDLDNSDPLERGTPQDIVFDPANELHVRHFTGNAGDFIELAFATTGGQQEWEVIDPFGNTVADGRTNYTFQMSLPHDGQYTLLLGGRASDTTPATVSVALTQTAPTPLTLGELQIAPLSSYGKLAQFAFSLDAEKRLVFDSRFNSSKSVWWSVRDTDGNIIKDSTRIDAGGASNWFDASAGDYVLTIVSSGGIGPFLGDLPFRLVDLRAGPEIVIGDQVDGAVDVGTDVSVYEFDGLAGQELIFDVLSYSESTYGASAWILDENNRVILYQALSTLSPFTLSADGRYTVMIEPPGGRINPVSFAFRLTPVVTVENRPIAFGERIEDSLDAVGERREYTFSLDTAGEVYFDRMLYDTSLYWQVRNANGDILANSNFNREGQSGSTEYSRLFLADGDYTLILYRTDDQPGPVVFRLLSFGALQEVPLGSPTPVQLDPGDVTQGYRFAGSAGQRIAIDLPGGTPSAVSWRLIAPNGATLWNANLGTQPAVTLRETGDYVLLFEGAQSASNPRETRFIIVEAPYSAPIPVGTGIKDAPDLVPLNIVVSANGAPRAGEQVTITWTLANNGEVPSPDGIRDRVILRRADTGEIIGVAVTQAAPALLPGQTATRQQVFTLPAGSLGTGDIVAHVEVDIDNLADETSGGLAREANNTLTLPFTAESDALPDLVIANVTTEPATGYRGGEPVTVSWQTVNDGDEPVTTSFIEQVRVRNQSRAGLTIAIATTPYDVTTLGPIEAGGVRDRTLTFLWPEGLDGTGAFAFEVTTDLDAVVIEDNDQATGESNNTTTLSVVSAPDLVAENLRIEPASPSAGDTVTFSWTTRNAGNADAPVTWTDRIRLRNETAGTDLISNIVIPHDPTHGDSLAAGATRERSVTFKIPDGALGAGDLTVYLNLDWYSQVRELLANGSSGENNNSNSLGFVSTERLYPNLTVANAPIVTGSTKAGATITVDWQVRNDGSTGSGQRSDRIMLSADDILGNDDDIVLTTVSRPALGIGETDPASTLVTLPTDLLGSYRLWILADADNNVNEGDDENDNASPGLLLNITEADTPDLRVEAVAGPTTASWGESVNLLWRVGNAGNLGTSGGWTDRVLLSSDAIPDAGDIVLAEIAAPQNLAPGGTYVNSASVIIPGGLSGSYRLIVVTDSADDVDEGLQEDNNADAALEPIAVSSSPAPDLVVSLVEGPLTGEPGTTQTVRWRVDNIGEGPARAPFSDRIYLTQTGTLSGARYLGELNRTIDVLSQEGYDAEIDITVPTDLAPGEWRFLVITDFREAVYELGREDNSRLADDPLAISTPNLVITNLSAPENASSGETVTITWTVENQGGGTAGAGRIDRVLLSRDDSPDSTDIVLAEVQNGAIAPNGFQPSSVDVELPIDASGAYRILLVTDATDIVEEQTGEDDNVAGRDFGVSLSPHSDLAVSNVTAPDLTVADPATISIGWTVTNESDGVGRETGWVDTVYASRDDVIGDGDDFVLATIENNAPLGSGESYSRVVEVMLPAGFSERLRIYVVADKDGTVFENGLTANNTALADNVTDVANAPYADLVLTDIEVAPDASSGGTLAIAWTVRNDGIGQTDRTQWTDQIILSRNPDGSGVVATERFTHLGALAVGASYRREAQIGLPDGLEGTFYIQAVTGGPYEFIYTDNNRSGFVPVSVTLSPSPDLRVAEIATLETAVEGDVIDVAWRVVNEGAASATGTWTDTLVLEAIADGVSDIVIGSFTIDADLAPGQSYARTERFRLPDQIQGAYRLVVTTNVNGTLYEHGTAADNNSETDDRPLDVQLKPRPNLQVASIVTAPSVSAGGTIQATFEIINQGAVAATGQWTDSVYISLDDTLSADDILVGRYDNPLALGAGESYSVTSDPIAVPLRWSGDAYVLVATDIRGNVSEYPFENDNTGSERFEVIGAPRPDLVTSEVVAPLQAVYGAEIEVRYTVTNNGAGATSDSSWKDTIWITRDKRRPNTAAFADAGGADFLKGNSARLLATITHVGALEVGESYEQVVRVRIPADLESGTYYITPWSDSFDVEPEDTLAINVNPDDPNEFDNNNYKARQIEVLGFTPVRPDLVVEAVSTGGPVVAGSEPLQVTWTVRNTGLAASGADEWVDRIYVSDRPTLGEAGETLWLLGDVRRQGGLQPDETYQGSAVFDLPPSVKGQYVHVVADAVVRVGRNSYSDAVFEEDESNNTGSADADVSDAPADLRVVSVSALTPAVSGEKVTVSWTVENVGSDVWSGTGYWHDAVWLSRDPVLNTGRATFLTRAVYSPTTPLASGQSYTQTAEVTLPPGSEGQWYLHVATDVGSTGTTPRGETTFGNAKTALSTYASSVYETTDDPTGNYGRGSLDIIFREPDLQVTELDVAGEAQSGGSLALTYTVSNTGTRATREDRWTDRIFLSRDGSLDSGDLLLGSFDRFGALGAGESYQEVLNLPIPSASRATSP